MLNLNKKLFAAAVGVILSTPIFAESGNTLDNYRSGFYIGMLGGYSTSTIGGLNELSDIQKKLTGSGIEKTNNKFGVGACWGYSFCPYFSIDFINYTYYSGGKISAGAEEWNYSTHAINIMAKGILPLEVINKSLSGFSVYGKLGPSFNATLLEIKNKTTKLTDSTTSGKVKLGYALGISYNFNDRVALDLSWSGIYSKDDIRNHRFNFYNSSDNKFVPAVNLYALGISYKF